MSSELVGCEMVSVVWTIMAALKNILFVSHDLSVGALLRRVRQHDAVDLRIPPVYW